MGLAKGTDSDEGPSPAKIVKTEVTPSTSSSTAEPPPNKVAIASGADTNFQGYQVKWNLVFGPQNFYVRSLLQY